MTAPTYEQTSGVLRTAARLTTERRRYWPFGQPHPGDIKGIIRDTAACHGLEKEAVAKIIRGIKG